jgi:hypothetical protein
LVSSTTAPIKLSSRGRSSVVNPDRHSLGVASGAGRYEQAVAPRAERHRFAALGVTNDEFARQECSGPLDTASTERERRYGHGNGIAPTTGSEIPAEGQGLEGV